MAHLQQPAADEGCKDKRQVVVHQIRPNKRKNEYHVSIQSETVAMLLAIMSHLERAR